jgi:cold shock CspA family protein
MIFVDMPSINGAGDYHIDFDLLLKLAVLKGVAPVCQVFTKRAPASSGSGDTGTERFLAALRRRSASVSYQMVDSSDEITAHISARMVVEAVAGRPVMLLTNNNSFHAAWEIVQTHCPTSVLMTTRITNSPLRNCAYSYINGLLVYNLFPYPEAKKDSTEGGQNEEMEILSRSDFSYRGVISAYHVERGFGFLSYTEALPAQKEVADIFFHVSDFQQHIKSDEVLELRNNVVPVMFDLFSSRKYGEKEMKLIAKNLVPLY